MNSDVTNFIVRGCFGCDPFCKQMFINIFGSIKSKNCSAILRPRRAGPCLCPLHFAFELIRFHLQASPLNTARSSNWGVRGNVHRVIKRSWGGVDMNTPVGREGRSSPPLMIPLFFATA